MPHQGQRTLRHTRRQAEFAWPRIRVSLTTMRRWQKTSDAPRCSRWSGDVHREEASAGRIEIVGRDEAWDPSKCRHSPPVPRRRCPAVCAGAIPFGHVPLAAVLVQADQAVESGCATCGKCMRRSEGSGFAADRNDRVVDEEGRSGAIVSCRAGRINRRSGF